MATATKTQIKPITGKKPGTAIQPWEAELAAAAKKQAAAEKPMGMFKQVAVNGGVMIVDEKPVPGNAMDVVVLAATHENQYYNRAYDPNTPAVPVCFAFGDQDVEDPEAVMVPHAQSDEPQGYPMDDKGQLVEDGERSCANCWANRMGTADVGKGKACKNIRRMIITTADSVDSVDALKNGEARMFKVPVMSVKNWVNFAHECDDEYHRPYYGVIAELKVVPDKKSQWQIQFNFKELVNFTGELYEQMKKRVTSAAKDLLSPYPKLDDEANAAPKGRSTGKAPQGPAARKKSKY